MRAIVLATGLLLASAAEAAPYDDFAQGIAANQRGAPLEAIASFSAALSQPGLSPALMPLAYRGRAIAYLRLGRCAPAMADLDQGLALKPDDKEMMIDHAEVHLCQHDLATAEAELGPVIAKYPSADVYGSRGDIRWRLANYAGAAEDFAQALRLDPTDPYAFLWLELARQRTGTFDAAKAEEDAHGLKLRTWPGPIASLYLGDASPEEVDRAAQEPDHKPLEVQACEADFFLGEWALVHKDADGARSRLSRLRGRCPRYTSYAAADLERSP